MISYFLRSGLSMLVIYGIYHFLLQQEKMPRFNRFYLIGGLLFSFLAPLFTLTYGADLFSNELLHQFIAAPAEYQIVNAPLTEASNPLNYGFVLKLIYGSITLLLLTRFVYRISLLFSKAQQNPHQNYQGAKLVFVKEKTMPYTFFNAIFVEESSYRKKKIPAELFTHELTHARQWHSLDIILLELLRAIFWINPLFVIYKKAIQLNHEYLADDQVIHKHQQPKTYQNLLINKNYINSNTPLISHFNYLVTKKRLNMMYKKTSRVRTYAYATLCIPLFTFLLFICANKVEAQTNASDKQTTETAKDDYFKNATFVCKDKAGKIIHKSYNDLTAAEKENVPPPPPLPPSVDGAQRKLNPLPEGSKVELTGNGRVIFHKGNKAIPPPPPMPPKAPKGSKAVPAPAAPVAPAAVQPVRAPKPPKAEKAQKTMKTPKAPKAEKAAKSLKAPKAEKAPKAPKPGGSGN